MATKRYVFASAGAWVDSMARARLVYQLSCACDVAEAPSRESQIRSRQDSRVRTEAELGFAISNRIVNFQCLFQMRARLLEIALAEKSQS